MKVIHETSKEENNKDIKLYGLEVKGYFRQTGQLWQRLQKDEEAKGRNAYGDDDETKMETSS